MPAWFDILSLDDVMARQDEQGMLTSVQLVHRLITEEVDAGVPSDRIIVGGFSQGISLSNNFIYRRLCNSDSFRIYI